MVKAPIARKRLGLLFVAGSVVLAALLMLSLRRDPAEPVYDGHRLSYWLECGGLDPTYIRGGLQPSDIESTLNQRRQVFNSVGPEALPWLNRGLEEFITRKKFRSATHIVIDLHSGNIGIGLTREPWTQKPIYACYNTMNLLSKLAPGTAYERKAASLIAQVPNFRGGFLEYQILILSHFTNCPSIVIPVLLAGLTNSFTLEDSIDGLRIFSEQATPKLYQMALAETGSVVTASQALKEVNREAYSRMRKEKHYGLGMR
jgi:hypothetical protein